MQRKILTALIVSPLIFVLPAIGNLEAIGHAHLWILMAIGIIGSVCQPVYRPLDGSAPPHDYGTATQIVWSVYITQIAGVVEAAYFRYPQSFTWNSVSVLALLGVTFGFALRTWAVRELGRYFTWHITVLPDHKVVNTGPYRLLRHPSYTGAVVMYLCTLVFIHAWVTTSIAVAVLLFAYWRRIRYEEAWLIEHLGEDYRTYARRVKALIPMVW